ncbi:MAG: Alanine-tRNA ligase [Candidatus Moranbacteria bacterium GW2011_GWE1_35_17]|nr:MAG: Alanine-tRNA ligase [Candidatus Moranbacteria bacterium GW2011_GWE1_35_17]KKP70456.1 MAG: Alanine-tRNA ligase [Candidatus Moranbacteria bacterium GW2011_GWE2_35_164]KKP84618.1 MAG: Alanine-tRNA ligase [Candidatus Moranbacteria bacterium GW2011_GWF2_35_54]
MQAKEIRQKYLEFFKSKGHAIIPSASVVPENDPTVLFTTAGMHPLVPYLMGEIHPQGKRLADSQKCIRTGDIDDVGDNRHLTFFEMLGNWSLGDYFKKEAIAWSFEFLTDEKWLGLDPKKIYVTVFAGDENSPVDNESIETWKEQYKKVGIEAGVCGENEKAQSDSRIFLLGAKDNWWGPAGETGPCGPCSEMFYDVRPEEGELTGKTHEEWVDEFRIMEIWNDVFMEFNKVAPGKFEKMEQQNVDTGMGLERTITVLTGKENVFDTDLFLPIISKIEELSGKKYLFTKGDLGFEEMPECWITDMKSMRIIADHIKASVFIIADGIEPSNTERGYVLRRLIRRAIRQGHLLGINNNFTVEIAKVVQGMYGEVFPEVLNEKVLAELQKEEEKFRKTLDVGIKEYERVEHYIQSIKNDVEKLRKVLLFIRDNNFKQNLSLIELKENFVKRYLDYTPFEKIFKYYNENLKKYLSPLKPLNEKEFDKIKESLGESEFIFDEMDNALKNIKLNGVFVFYLYQTSGLPFEIIKEIADEKGLGIDEDKFNEELKKHQDLSRTASAGMFKGGLSDNKEETTALHTTAHLMLAGLRKVLGEHVHQKGSNINGERLRFDFSHPQKMTDEEKKQVEEFTNGAINAKVPVEMNEMSLDEARAQGAEGAFENKYGEVVKVYKINGYSNEICGGPHVSNTGDIKGKFRIAKEESSSSGVRRIKAILE